MNVVRIAALSLAATGVALAVAGCGSSARSSGGPAAPATVAPSPTNVAPAPSTTLPTTTPTSSAYVPSSPASSPDAAAADLVDDWSAGNRTSAAAVASPSAVAALFALAYPNGYIQDRGCTDATTNPGTCTYRNTKTNGIYEITVEQAAGGWYVSAVTAES